MSTTQDLITALKAELKAAGITYADLARELGMAESSIKRVFAKADMPLSRIDEVLRVLKMDFADLARKVADAQPLRRELTHEQEAAVVAEQQPVRSREGTAARGRVAIPGAMPRSGCYEYPSKNRVRTLLGYSCCGGAAPRHDYSE